MDISPLDIIATRTINTEYINSPLTDKWQGIIRYITLQRALYIHTVWVSSRKEAEEAAEIILSEIEKEEQQLIIMCQ